MATIVSSNSEQEVLNKISTLETPADYVLKNIQDVFYYTFFNNKFIGEIAEDEKQYFINCTIEFFDLFSDFKFASIK